MATIDQRDTSRPRVVVGVDGSDGAQAALRYALAAAAVRGAGLEILTGCAPELHWAAAAPLAVPDVLTVREATLARALDAVAAVSGDVPEAADVPLEVCVTVEPAAPELVRHSRGAALVVVGSRGHGAVRSALLGSAALHVATHAACPVVVVHPDPAELTPAGTGAPRVVVGVDGSPTGRAALVAAVDEAVRLGADLDLVACFAFDSYWAALYPDLVPSSDEIREDVRREAQEQVTAVLADRPQDAPVPEVHLEVVQGAPSDVLVERARGAALLVVGSSGRGAVRAALLGSVALHCAMNAPCPVLVVHPASTDAPEETVRQRARA
ncbi:universal stress protein [Blastococcus sp. SYSU D01042]